MTNLEKAIELAENSWMGDDSTAQTIRALSCLTGIQMAEWKDKRFEGKIKEIFGNGIEIDGTYWSTLELIRMLVQ